MFISYFSFNADGDNVLLFDQHPQPVPVLQHYISLLLILQDTELVVRKRDPDMTRFRCLWMAAFRVVPGFTSSVPPSTSQTPSTIDNFRFT